jgi:hypothetical protein
MRRTLVPLLLSGLCLLAGCDQLGIESASTINARKDADAKAIGGACRHAGRAIEDCYTLNKKADKAAVYAGWREMNEYMIENKLEPVVPVIPTEAARAPQPAASSADDAADAEDASGDEAPPKHKGKAKPKH